MKMKSKKRKEKKKNAPSKASENGLETSENAVSRGESTVPYISSALQPTHEHSYKAAGILLYKHVENEDVHCLMGLCYTEKRRQIKKSKRKKFVDASSFDKSLTFLGGKREKSETGSIATACREFDEETGGVLSANVNAIRDHLVLASNTSSPSMDRIDEKERTIQSEPLQQFHSSQEQLVYWIDDSRYALYLVDVETVPMLRDATKNVESAFREFCSSESSIELPLTHKEMVELRWVSLREIGSNSSTHFVGGAVSASAFQTWMQTTLSKREKGSATCSRITGLDTDHKR